MEPDTLNTSTARCSHAKRHLGRTIVSRGLDSGSLVAVVTKEISRCTEGGEVSLII